jgi:ankyrin repeat protein
LAACTFEGFSSLALLAANGIDFDSSVDDGGRTALHYAASADVPENIEYLIKLGINVNGRDKRGKTALHCAAGM